MNIEELREYCLSLGEVEEKMPFGKFARRYDSLLVFYVMGHIFCMTDIDDFSYVNVKSTPSELEALKAEHTSLGSPLNRGMKDWASLVLDGDIPDSKVYALISRSYEIIKDKYTKKPRKKNEKLQTEGMDAASARADNRHV